MTENLTKTVRLFTGWALWIRGLTPVKLPKSREDFEAFFNNLVQTYGIPATKDIRYTAASMIQHLSPTTHKKAPYFFAKSIHKAIANDTAYRVMQEIREEDRKRELEQKQAEATALNNGVALGDGSTI